MNRTRVALSLDVAAVALAAAGFICGVLVEPRSLDETTAPLFFSVFSVLAILLVLRDRRSARRAGLARVVKPTIWRVTLALLFLLFLIVNVSVLSGPVWMQLAVVLIGSSLAVPVVVATEALESS